MIHRLFRRKSDDSRAEGIWLTVYSDLMTNLVLVFLAMYGLVTMGNKAIEEAAVSMKSPGSSIKSMEDQTLTLESVTLLLRQEFKDNSEVAILEETGVTRIQLGETILFDSGRAELKPSAKPMLEKAATFLVLLPYTIVVEGHTDDRPIRGGVYRDNWELSLGRSMSVVDLLSKQGGIPAKQLAAAAYGFNHPRASNMTPDGRALNRRVEIALFRDVPFTL